ncbi:hypothetical protein E8E13_006971 [Curvularia kusanoi]|uniref:Uncharacterized protein n=1 Tax=Curvularia kusanoi TaxID=90978 RepID=A0A9P4THG7_CURKU|nr:hypothetical protein E8E13_006971 [Curvularia kusanoi]
MHWVRPLPYLVALFAALAVGQDSCSEPASRLYLPDPPYDNYIYFDCHSSSHVILTSPRPDSNLDIISPRLLVAWPAGNSGLVAYFEPADGVKGSLTPSLKNSSSTGEALDPIYEPVQGSTPRVGVAGSIFFNKPAKLTTAVLGSIRSVRDFTEGGGKLDPEVQSGLIYSGSDVSATINRTWFDGVTATVLNFTPLNGAPPVNFTSGSTFLFGAGAYGFNASFNYPQLEQLSQTEVLNPQSDYLISQQPDQTTSLSFLSYKNKLLAGTWRFLTYFGRDSMISMLLMQQILSEGENGAIEAVIGAVLERVDKEDGTVCHEEVIGDYATYLNRKDRNSSSTEPFCDYKMVDTDYFLPIAMQDYFINTETGKQRSEAFFDTTATFLPENKGLTYEELAEATMKKIMNATAAFAAEGGQTVDNLIHLRSNEPVGEWRDSNGGLGGGRIPYDVNTALVPAGLRAIAALSRAGFFADHKDWGETADRYAQVWEDSTLRFFEISVPKSDAVSLVKSYVAGINIPIPANTDSITSDVTYYGVALNGNIPPPSNASSPVVPLMNTDDCFRHFLLNTTNQAQLSAFLSQTADHILKPFPVGLATDVGLFVANPAYANNTAFAGEFGRGAYHGTVVWGWQLAMMGAGLGRQLGRCGGYESPDFCNDSALYGKVLTAYNRLWDLIESNTAQLSSEVWSWNYDNGAGFAPKKPAAKILEYLKPAVYKAEASASPKTPTTILEALTLAGLHKSSAPKAKSPKTSFPGPRKLTVRIINGNTDSLIHQYVPSRLLIGASAKAAEVLETKPWAGTFKVYGKYDIKAMNDVVNTIILSQKMPIATDLASKLLTYEACLRLGVQLAHASLKPLLIAINAQISSAPVSSEILSFITYRLGPKDAVFEHTANVLCHQRFKGEVDDVKAFEKLVARRPALQAKMVQIDQAHKARREALVASKRQCKIDAAEKSDPTDAVAVQLGAALVVSEAVDVEQKEKLLGLLKSGSD